MTTTLFYIEVLIIGLETTTWISLFSFLFLDNNQVEKLIDLSSRLPIAFLLLCFVYVIGIVSDRILSRLFESRVRDVKKNYILEPERVTYLIWKKFDREDAYNFSVSRKRILRATIINIPFVTVAIVANLLSRGYALLSVFIAAFGLIFFAASFKSFWILINEFYADTKRLIDENVGLPT